ncbi:MAG: protein kinase domain-containing protein [Planctomycetota bacterium]
MTRAIIPETCGKDGVVLCPDNSNNSDKNTVKLGDYILERRIGSGGMGRVYYGRQESLDRPVAIKILSRETASDKQSVMRFQREAKAIARLIHPNIIQVFSFGVEKGVPYFAMEHVDGKDLGLRLKGGEEFDTKESGKACAYSSKSPRRSRPRPSTTWFTATSSRAI